MDSITQMALGGALGAAVGGKKYGKKSALIGAFAGAIPDFDVFFFVNSDPVTSFTYHRGFTHAFLFAFIATPIVAHLLSKIKKLNVDFKDRCLHCIIFLGLFTHPLLDALTIYGTQLFWPIPSYPIGLGSMFIIDPLYSFPLFLGLAWFWKYGSQKAANVALIISTLYIVWGVAVQQYVYSIANQQLSVENHRVLVQTTPLNTILWRIVVMKEDTYDVGYYSLFDDTKDVAFTSYPREISALPPREDSETLRRLAWFTKGFYGVSTQNNRVVVSDLRMGNEPNSYIFQFYLDDRSKANSSRDFDAGKTWQRIWRDL